MTTEAKTGHVESGPTALKGKLVGLPPRILVQYCNSLLRKKVLFGSDWPMISPERWLSDFEKIEIKDEVRPLILKDNAARLLGLSKAEERS